MQQPLVLVVLGDSLTGLGAIGGRRIMLATIFNTRSRDEEEHHCIEGTRLKINIFAKGGILATVVVTLSPSVTGVDKCCSPRLRALRFLFPNSWRSSACVVMRDG